MKAEVCRFAFVAVVMMLFGLVVISLFNQNPIVYGFGFMLGLGAAIQLPAPRL